MQTNSTIGIPFEQYFKDNENFIHHILKRFTSMASRHNMDYDDLFSEGCIAFMKAYKRFDADRGLQFATYAASLIEGYVRTFLSKNVSTIHFSRSAKDVLFKIRPYLEQGYSANQILELGIEYRDKPLSREYLEQGEQERKAMAPVVKKEASPEDIDSLRDIYNKKLRVLDDREAKLNEREAAIQFEIDSYAAIQAVDRQQKLQSGELKRTSALSFYTDGRNISYETLRNELLHVVDSALKIAKDAKFDLKLEVETNSGE